ncbi:MAG: sensor [Nitrospirales bacterium]|nr:MAG: sensor [Nitrospirales bacterium]
MNDDQESMEPRSPRDQAIDWFLRLQSGEVSARDLERHESWLHEHLVHREEYEQVAAMWEDFDQVEPLLTEPSYSSKSLKRSNSTTQAFARSETMTQKLGHLSAVAAPFLVVLLLGIWWWPDSPVLEESFRTAKGEQRTVNLSDGSTMLMNTDSQVFVRMSGEARRVTLQRGEALFTVTHDAQRPFDVHAANGIIHDIGTQFLVRHTSETVQVSVLEGLVKVEVTNAVSARSTNHSHMLKEGDHVWYEASGHLSSVQAFDRAMITAWTDAMLYFDAKPLKEVLAEWARYRPGEIRSHDPSLGTIPISGKFQIDQFDSFLHALENTLDIHTRHLAPQVIVLKRHVDGERVN